MIIRRKTISIILAFCLTFVSFLQVVKPERVSALESTVSLEEVYRLKEIFLEMTDEELITFIKTNDVTNNTDFYYFSTPTQSSTISTNQINPISPVPYQVLVAAISFFYKNYPCTMDTMLHSIANKNIHTNGEPYKTKIQNNATYKTIISDINSRRLTHTYNGYQFVNDTDLFLSINKFEAKFSPYYTNAIIGQIYIHDVYDFETSNNQGFVEYLGNLVGEVGTYLNLFHPIDIYISFEKNV